MRQISIEGQNNGIKANKRNISRRVKSGILATGMMIGGVVIGTANEAKAEIIVPGEMLSQKGSVLDQLEKGVASGKAETTVGLGSIEKEKKPEEIIAENIVSFLKAETPHTDEEIKSELFTGPKPEKIVDLGLISYGSYIQGRFLGYLKTEDKENLLLFIGLKNRKQDRFVTALRLPLYLYEDKAVPHDFLFYKYGGRDLTRGCLNNHNYT